MAIEKVGLNGKPKHGAIVVGDSHYAALHAAATETISVAGATQTGCELFFFNAWKYSLLYPFTVTNEGKTTLNTEFLGFIEPIMALISDCPIFMLFGGGHHAAVTTILHPRPFDFILPEREDLPLLQDHELVPTAFMHDFMSDLVREVTINIKSVREAFPNSRCMQIESPPPNGDETYLKLHLDTWFSKNFPQERLGRVTPRSIRFKAWRLHSRVISQTCSELGVDFIKAPKEAADTDGFLEPRYYGADATHANSLYGRLILDQIENIIGHKFDRWSTFG